MRPHFALLISLFLAGACKETKPASTAQPAAKPSEPAQAAPAPASEPAFKERTPEVWARAVIGHRLAREIDDLRGLIDPDGTLEVTYTDSKEHATTASFTRTTLQLQAFPHDDGWLTRWTTPELAQYVAPECTTSATGFACRSAFQRGSVTFTFKRSGASVFLAKVDEFEDEAFGAE